MDRMTLLIVGLGILVLGAIALVWRLSTHRNVSARVKGPGGLDMGVGASDPQGEAVVEGSTSRKGAIRSEGGPGDKVRVSNSTAEKDISAKVRSRADKAGHNPKA